MSSGRTSTLLVFSSLVIAMMNRRRADRRRSSSRARTGPPTALARVPAHASSAAGRGCRQVASLRVIWVRPAVSRAVMSRSAWAKGSVWVDHSDANRGGSFAEQAWHEKAAGGPNLHGDRPRRAHDASKFCKAECWRAQIGKCENADGGVDHRSGQRKSCQIGYHRQQPVVATSNPADTSTATTRVEGSRCSSRRPPILFQQLRRGRDRPVAQAAGRQRQRQPSDASGCGRNCSLAHRRLPSPHAAAAATPCRPVCLTPGPQADRQAVTHGTRVSVTIAAKIAATTPSTARGTMPIQYAGIGSSR